MQMRWKYTICPLLVPKDVAKYEFNKIRDIQLSESHVEDIRVWIMQDAVPM